MSRAQDMIEEMMKKRKMNYSQVSNVMGEVRQLMRQRMNVADDLKAAMFFDLVEALGYEIEVKDKYIMKVSEAFIERIKNKNSKWHGGFPRGLYYHEQGNAYEAFDTRDGKIKSLLFTDKEEMYKWAKAVSRPRSKEEIVSKLA